MDNPKKLVILYGSQTFTAKDIAEKIWRDTKVLGFKGPVKALDEYPAPKLIYEDIVLFVVSTTGHGEPPDNMKNFWSFILRKSLPNTSLNALRYGVVGLGDSSYAKFNYVGKKINRRMQQLGAVPLLDPAFCDYQHDLGHDGTLQPWLKLLYKKLKLFYPEIELENLSSHFTPRWNVSLIKDVEKKPSEITYDIHFIENIDKKLCEPKYLEVESNVRTTAEDHFQDVRMITLTVTNDEELSYQPCDVFNVRPRNSKEDVDTLFSMFDTLNMDIKPYYRLLVEARYDDMPVPDIFSTPLPLQVVAEQYWDLKCIPTQYAFSLLAFNSEDKLEKDKCIELASAEGQEDWLNYCRRPRRTVIEVLQDFHKSTSKLTIDILFEFFSTIKPRSFSIASSCLHTKRKKIELLVAVVNFHTKLRKPRLGLCSNWLKNLKKGAQIVGWITKGTFTFPENKDTPLIMIGPGTGLAPFRNLILERKAMDTATNETLHLYFGCRRKEKDFHCADELTQLAKSGFISLVCAFSRDQDEKIYVQHQIANTSSKLMELMKQNAYIYIAGNAKNMPESVKTALIDHVILPVSRDRQEAINVLKDLEANRKLQMETW